MNTSNITLNDFIGENLKYSSTLSESKFKEYNYLLSIGLHCTNLGLAYRESSMFTSFLGNEAKNKVSKIIKNYLSSKLNVNDQIVFAFFADSFSLNKNSFSFKQDCLAVFSKNKITIYYYSFLAFKQYEIPVKNIKYIQLLKKEGIINFTSLSIYYKSGEEVALMTKKSLFDFIKFKLTAASDFNQINNISYNFSEKINKISNVYFSFEVIKYELYLKNNLGQSVKKCISTTEDNKLLVEKVINKINSVGSLSNQNIEKLMLELCDCRNKTDYEMVLNKYENISKDTFDIETYTKGFENLRENGLLSVVDLLRFEEEAELCKTKSEFDIILSKYIIKARDYSSYVKDNFGID